MKTWYYLCVSLMTALSVHAVVFDGILENGITINNFLCSGDAVNIENCTPADAGSVGFDLSNGKMLQLFNDQAGWLLLQASRKQYLNQDLKRSGSSLNTQLATQGWAAMGGYCLVITTNGLLADVVKPELVAHKDQEKIVVQLWYNGDQEIQLWSQDAKILSKEESFKVIVSADADSLVIENNSAKSLTNSLRLKFLSQLNIEENNRKESVYQLATHSPRSVKIQSS